MWSWKSCQSSAQSSATEPEMIIFFTYHLCVIPIRFCSHEHARYPTVLLKITEAKVSKAESNATLSSHLHRKKIHLAFFIYFSFYTQSFCHFTKDPAPGSAGNGIFFILETVKGENDQIEKYRGR